MSHSSVKYSRPIFGQSKSAHAVKHTNMLSRVLEEAGFDPSRFYVSSASPAFKPTTGNRGRGIEVEKVADGDPIIFAVLPEGEPGENRIRIWVRGLTAEPTVIGRLEDACSKVNAETFPKLFRYAAKGTNEVNDITELQSAGISTETPSAMANDNPPDEPAWKTTIGNQLISGITDDIGWVPKSNLWLACQPSLADISEAVFDGYLEAMVSLNEIERCSHKGTTYYRNMALVPQDVAEIPLYILACAQALGQLLRKDTKRIDRAAYLEILQSAYSSPVSSATAISYISKLKHEFGVLGQDVVTKDYFIQKEKIAYFPDPSVKTHAVTVCLIPEQPEEEETVKEDAPKQSGYVKINKPAPQIQSAPSGSDALKIASRLLRSSEERSAPYRELIAAQNADLAQRAKLQEEQVTQEAALARMKREQLELEEQLSGTVSAVASVNQCIEQRELEIQAVDPQTKASLADFEDAVKLVAALGG